MAEEAKSSCLGAGTQLARCKVCSCLTSVFLSDRKFLLDWKICFMLSSILNKAYLVAISTLAVQLHLLPIMHLNSSSAMKWKCEENKTAETFHSSRMLIRLAMDAQRDKKSAMGPRQRNEGRVESPSGVFSGRWGDDCSGQADTELTTGNTRRSCRSYLGAPGSRRRWRRGRWSWGPCPCGRWPGWCRSAGRCSRRGSGTGRSWGTAARRCRSCRAARHTPCTRSAGPTRSPGSCVPQGSCTHQGTKDH